MTDSVPIHHIAANDHREPCVTRPNVDDADPEGLRGLVIGEQRLRHFFGQHLRLQGGLLLVAHETSGQ